MKLAGCAVAPQVGFQLRHRFLWKSLRPEQIPVLCPSVVGGDMRVVALVARWQTQVLPAALVQQMARQVLVMQPLHDDDVGATHGVIEPVGHRLVPPVEGPLADDLTLLVADVVRIVDDNDVAAFAGKRAADGGRQPVAAPVIVEARLGVLVAGQVEAVAPAPLVDRAFDDAAALDAIPCAQPLRVAGEQEASFGRRDPCPRRPGNGHADGLHMARRHVDE